MSAPAIFANVTWVTTPLKYMGTPLECYRDTEPYLRGQVQTLKDKAEKVKATGLAEFARATTCNIFFLAKLWYVSECCIVRVLLCRSYIAY